MGSTLVHIASEALLPICLGHIIPQHSHGLILGPLPYDLPAETGGNHGVLWGLSASQTYLARSRVPIRKNKKKVHKSSVEQIGKYVLP